MVFLFVRLQKKGEKMAEYQRWKRSDIYANSFFNQRRRKHETQR